MVHSPPCLDICHAGGQQGLLGSYAFLCVLSFLAASFWTRVWGLFHVQTAHIVFQMACIHSKLLYFHLVWSQNRMKRIQEKPRKLKPQVPFLCHFLGGWKVEKGTPINYIAFKVFYRLFETHLPAWQEYQWLEFFAGVGNLTKVMRSAKYKSCRFDLLDNPNPGSHKSNYMNLLHASGFAPLVFENIGKQGSKASLKSSTWSKLFWKMVGSTKASSAVPFEMRAQWLCHPLWH